MSRLRNFVSITVTFLSIVFIATDIARAWDGAIWGNLPVQERVPLHDAALMMAAWAVGIWLCKAVMRRIDERLTRLDERYRQREAVIIRAVVSQRDDETASTKPLPVLRSVNCS